MKKIVFLIVISAVFCTALRAQNTRVSTDTMPCVTRMSNYWYSSWYDTLDWYLYGSALDSIHVYNDGRDTYYFHWTPYQVGFDGITTAEESGRNFVNVFRHCAPHPIRIRGLWAMVSQYAGDMMDIPFGGDCWPILDSTRLAEYFYLYVPKSGADSTSKPGFDLNRIATLRWDTAQPKMMCLPITLDPVFAGQNLYCHVYEALFDTVYTLEGEFWIGGSQLSNSLRTTGPPPYGHQHFPTRYITFGSQDMRDPCSAPRIYGSDPDGPFHEMSCSVRNVGPFGVITDGQRYVEVSVNDSVQGLGLYTAFYPDSTYQTISAVPNHGYRFSHWNDSVTNNPRTIFVTCDTAFTAYFDSLPEYHMSAESGDEDLGSVSGSGTYYEGETVSIWARANRRARFVCWNDSVTANPRSILMTSDTAFTAYFEDLPLYHLDVYSNNETYGHVEGSGMFYEDESVNIRALPHPGYYFWKWHDGNTFTIRDVTVTQDTSFTALFKSKYDTEGLQEVVAEGARFSLLPNPASGSVLCVVDGESFEGGVLTVTDAAGRELMRHELAPLTASLRLDLSALPAGTYFVTLATPQGSSTQKLILE